MITCLEISTRAIGNALFEYATLFGVGNKLGLDIRMPTGENHTHHTGQKIWQLKEIFDIDTPYITQAEIDNIQHTYTEKRKEFNPEIFEEVKDNTNLIGFFQHEDYFNFCEKELKEQLQFKQNWRLAAIDKFISLDINPYNCAAIHVRRGDYTLPHLQPFHPLLPIEYYIAAFQRLESYLINKFENLLETKLLIFSDDILYCKEHFKNDNMIVIDNSGESSNILDMTMFSMCSYHILANSSFGWWGAWLANSECVIYPHVWFGPGYNNYNIVSNPKWIKV